MRGRFGHGGKRPGAGRPARPPEEVRRNRLLVLFTDHELRQLRALAAKQGIPTGTAAHRIIKRALRRRS
jgi:hypothetical protein